MPILEREIALDGHGSIQRPLHACHAAAWPEQMQSSHGPGASKCDPMIDVLSKSRFWDSPTGSLPKSAEGMPPVHQYMSRLQRQELHVGQRTNEGIVTGPFDPRHS